MLHLECNYSHAHAVNYYLGTSRHLIYDYTNLCFEESAIWIVDVNTSQIDG